MPALQRAHAVAPASVVNAPAGHERQRAEPVVGAKKPMGHAAHALEAALSAKAPLGQGAQDRLPAAPA